MKPNIKFLFAAFLILVSLILVDLNNAYAQTPQETLNQYVSELQSNPNNNALREKIIKHVLEMKPKPALPNEIREHYVMARTFQEKAKDNSSYALAIEEYKKALLIAPWWPEGYKNIGILQKLIGQYDEAIQSLNLYILTKPADENDAQDEIYKIKAAKKMAETERSAAEVKKTKDVDLSGTWYQEPAKTCWRYKFAVNGKEIIITKFCNEGEEEELVGWATLNERTFDGKNNTAPNKYGATACAGSIRGVISEDNRNIKISFPSCHGGTYEQNLVRK